MNIQAALNTIDNIAGSVRTQYITVTPGQEATYILKMLEVERYIAAGYPTDMTGYYFVPMESASLEITPAEFCAMVHARVILWTSVSAQIESKREYWKKRVSQSTNADEIPNLVIMAQNDLCMLVH